MRDDLPQLTRTRAPKIAWIDSNGWLACPSPGEPQRN